MRQRRLSAWDTVTLTPCQKLRPPNQFQLLRRLNFGDVEAVCRNSACPVWHNEFVVAVFPKTDHRPSRSISGCEMPQGHRYHRHIAWPIAHPSIPHIA